MNEILEALDYLRERDEEDLLSLRLEYAQHGDPAWEEAA